MAQVRLVGPGTPTDVRAEIQTDRRIQKKPGLRSIPYDSINADISRIAPAEEYVIFLMTSPYEVVSRRGRCSRAFQAYLGHRNVQHTVRYTELLPDRFNDFWR